MPSAWVWPSALEWMLAAESQSAEPVSGLQSVGQELGWPSVVESQSGWPLAVEWALAPVWPLAPVWTSAELELVTVSG